MSIRRHPAEFGHAFGRRLSELLAERRLSQQDLAAKLKASPGFVSSLARGLKVPGTEFLVSLREALAVSLDWLCTGQGKRYGSEIDGDLFLSVLLQVQLVRLATTESSVEAAALLRSALPDLDLGQARDVRSEESSTQVLKSLMKQNEDVAATISILNRELLDLPPHERVAAAASAIRELVRSKREPSIVSLFRNPLPPDAQGGPNKDRDFENWDSPRPVDSGRSSESAGRKRGGRKKQ